MRTHLCSCRRTTNGAHVVPLLYSSALQHLLDLIFVTLCEDGEGRLKRLVESLKRIEQVMEP